MKLLLSGHDERGKNRVKKLAGISLIYCARNVGNQVRVLSAMDADLGEDEGCDVARSCFVAILTDALMGLGEVTFDAAVMDAKSGWRAMDGVEE